ncbi:MAG: hypothetical protein GY754_20770 [bacterium]|nr:hypothetical protein [bacterium]
MKKTVLLIIIMAAAAAFSCSHWKVTSLKSKEFAFIKNCEKPKPKEDPKKKPRNKPKPKEEKISIECGKPGSVLIKTDDYALKQLSFGVGVFDGKICTVDNILKRVQVLTPDNDVELILGSLKDVDTKDIDAAKFKFSIIGSFTMDDDDNIYIQNRLPQSGSQSYRGSANSEGMNFSPSYILVFNEKGKLQYTLGEKGTPDLPFYYIERLDIDQEGRLFVISRSFETWTVYRFKGKKRDLAINLAKIEFVEKEGEDTFKGKIENVKTYQSGEEILISVAYYHDLRLKYRKVYNYSIENKRIMKTIVNIPDPKNVLFNLVDDKNIYFWNMDSRNVKFMKCDMEGKIIDNIRLEIDDTKNYYSKVIGNKSGLIYSYHVTKKGIKILEWE